MEVPARLRLLLSARRMGASFRNWKRRFQLVLVPVGSSPSATAEAPRSVSMYVHLSRLGHGLSCVVSSRLPQPPFLSAQARQLTEQHEAQLIYWDTGML